MANQPLWIAPKPDPRKMNQPEGPSSYFLDAKAAGDERLAARIWKDKRAKIRNQKELVKRGQPGSWNHWPVALVAQLLAVESKPEKEQMIGKLVTYCNRQLNQIEKPEEKHDLWGLEILSRIYPWPISVMAQAHDWALENRKKLASAEKLVAADGPLTRLCRAHAYTLALFALTHPYPGSTVKDVFICAPGMRSRKRESGEQISKIFASILGRSPKSPPSPGNRAAWAERVAWAARHGYLSAQEKVDLYEHCKTGGMAEEIVEKLREYGVKFFTPVQVWRYKSGDYLALAKMNIHGSTPPIMAMSRVGGEYYHLSPHPKKMRGGGKKGPKMGHPSRCWREDDMVHAVFENVVLRKNGEATHLVGSIPAPPADQELIYSVRIGQEREDADKADKGIHLLKGDQDSEVDDQRRGQLMRKWAKGTAMAAEKDGKTDPDHKIYKHAKAIDRLLGPNQQDEFDNEQIYKHAKVILKLESDAGGDAHKRNVVNHARQVVTVHERWA